MFNKVFSVDRKYVWPLSLLAIGAIVGIIASFVLSVEAIELAKNQDAVLPCSINDALNCAAVGKDPTAHIFGFPNAFVGLLTLPVMLTIAVAALMGTRFPKPFMFMAQIGAIGGAIFAGWMLYVSFFNIQVLCPWCLTTDLAMLIMLLGLTRYNILEDNLYLSSKASKSAKKFVNQGFDALVGVVIFMVVAVGIILKFGQTLFS